MSLLEAVLANPEDDAPRLVYADSLLEAGDPRGELINVQVRVARLERDGAITTPEYRALWRRERELLRVMPKGRFHRGFIDRLLVEPRTFEAEWEAEPNRGLVEELKVMWGAHVSLNRLRAFGGKAPRLRTITFENHDGGSFELDAQIAFAAVAASSTPVIDDHDALPHPSLRDAIVSVNHIEPSGDALRALARADPPRLRKLSIFKTSAHTWLRAGIAELAKSQAFQRLELLELWGMAHDELEAALAGAKTNRVLKDVAAGLHEDQFEPGDLGEWLASVETLALSADATDAIIATLAARAPKLEELSLLATNAPRFDPLAKQLRWLALGSQATAASGAVARTPFERLTYLSLSGFMLDELIEHETLVDVAFPGCRFPSPAHEQRYRARWPEAFAEPPAVKARRR